MFFYTFFLENPGAEKKKGRTQQRGQPAADIPKKGVKRTQKSPPVKPAKKARLDNSKSLNCSLKSLKCIITYCSVFRYSEPDNFFQ